MQVVFAEALESSESALAVVGDGVVCAFFNVGTDVIGTALSKLCDEVIDLLKKNFETFKDEAEYC